MSAAKHTPGPWQWFERMPGRPYLATPDRGQLYVLGFERKGMQGAGPVFSHWPGIDDGAERERKGGIMEPGLLLRDGQMHPDARLIASSPRLLAALQGALASLQWHVDQHGPVGTDKARIAEALAAIAEAQGATP